MKMSCYRRCLYFLFAAVVFTIYCFFTRFFNEWPPTRQTLKMPWNSTIVLTTTPQTLKVPWNSTIALTTTYQTLKMPWNSTIVLTTTNTGFLDITTNMLESAKRTGACHNITVIAEDAQSYKALSEKAKIQPGLCIQKTNSGKTSRKVLKLNTKVYNHFVNKRPAYLLSFLEKGNRVLFVDADTYWFHDPLKDVDWDFDIALHNELDEPEQWFCDGVVYYNPTKNTIILVKEWAHLLATTEKDTPDQYVLNDLISNKMIPELKVKTLKNSQFPDGFLYFDNKGLKEQNNDAIVLHLSYIIGHDEKVKILKNNGFWVV